MRDSSHALFFFRESYRKPTRRRLCYTHNELVKSLSDLRIQQYTGKQSMQRKNSARRR
jgi:hypothetical protein